jgi:hypothetical protein
MRARPSTTMRSNNVCEARSEVFIHQGMNCCLLAGCDAHIEHGQQGHVDNGCIGAARRLALFSEPKKETLRFALAARTQTSRDGGHTSTQQPDPAQIS